MKTRKKTECEKNPDSLACLKEQLSNLRSHLIICQQEATGVYGWHDDDISHLEGLIVMRQT